jgi:hypothetical protein
MAHIECQKPPVEKAESIERTVLNYSDLRNDYFASVEHGKTNEILNRAANRSVWNSESNGSPSWRGATNAQALDWLKSGYRVPGLEGVDSTLIPGAPKRKIRFAEEGDEMLIDLVWSGVDEAFMTWDKRNTKPSLKVEINISFSASVSATTVNAYQSWVARMLQTIDSFGLDMQVDLISPGRGQWADDYQSIHTVAIRVKESGEASDFGSWSPMFSPAGFRHFTFLGIIKCADIHGKDVSGGLGFPVFSDAWNVSYNAETQTLSVGNKNGRSDFPEFEMTQKFIAVMQGVTAN